MAILNLPTFIEQKEKTPEQRMLESLQQMQIERTPVPAVEVPRFTRYGNRMAERGGFDVLPQEQLSRMTQQEIDQYEAERRKARGAGISETLLRMGQAFQGLDASGLALERQQARQAQEAQAEQNRLMQQLAQDPRYADQIKLIQAGLDPKMFSPTKLTADQDNYRLAKKQGYKGTFLDYMKEKKAPLVTIDQKEETEFQKQATQSAFRTLEKAQQEVNQFVDIEGRLNILQKQLESGELETGIFEEMKIPFQRLAAGLNILPEDELKKLGSKELFTRTVNYIVPRMRVAGSGSTSDTEVQLFKESAPSLQLEEGGNLLIVGGMSAVAKHNRERLKLMEKYMQDEDLGDGDLVGFGEYADSELGHVFKSYDSDSSFDKQVKEGKLKAGDFVYDGIFNEFRILTDNDIRGAR